MCSGNENVLQLQEDSRGDIDTVTNKMQDLPECVLERLFKHLDVRRLKACRLVSKKWNKEACLVLRKRTSTYFVNNETVGCRNRYSDFKELMKTRDPQNTHIPVPFECFDICLYVRFSNLEEFCQGVDNILEKTRGEVWKLKVGLGPTKNSPNELDLYPFLEKHSRTMTHFEVETGFSCKLPQLRVKNLEFPSLKSLTFGISEAADDTIKDLIVQSINGSQRLNHATIHADRRTNARNIPGTNVLLDLMALPKFGTIQSLSFDVSSSIAMASVIRGLKSLQQLVALEFRYTRNQSFKPPDDLTIDLLKTLRQFSEQIQYLDLGNFQLNRNLVDAYFPFCPCLKSLGMWEFQPGSHYFHKAPNLKMFVFYQNCSPPDIASESIVCHEAVESINIDETKQLSLPDFGFLQKQFPNCKQLRMHTSLANQYFSAALKDESIVAGWKKLESLI
ncbi:unnamed protein product [Allacma fusca]|uniref:F-box domain-containing protein n=1 Tax=Allacma fusca TaxID=39272 RepID=A0A8J2Q603_9HEXA|nr:unnamed protein product [Allacma fusca]